MNENPQGSVPSKILRYTASAIAVLGTSIISFFLLLFALKDTPLHNGDELPSLPLLSVSLVGGLLAGSIVVFILTWVQKRRT